MKEWHEQFARFCERKTSEAASATLHPYITDNDRHDDRFLAVGNGWTSQIFDGPFFLSEQEDPNRASCSLVFVQSLDGNTGAKDPAALGGGETDKHLVYEGLSRVAADAVLAGAETVRGGSLILSVWHPELVQLRRSLGLPRHPVQMVATLKGLDLTHALMFNVPDAPVILLTSADAARQMRVAVAERPWIRTVVTDGKRGWSEAFEALPGLGIHRVSCIGGRHLATQLLDAWLVRDVYLTTSPHRGGEANTPLYPKPLGGTLVVRKRGTGAEAGVVFEHVHLSRTQRTQRTPRTQET
jgi:riboflavin biosynthesis pyrimidine reductase